MADSETAIANRALQILEDKPVLDISDTSPRAKACHRAYKPVRRAELRAHNWNFARKRAALAPDAVAPVFGYEHAYTQPADCLCIRPQSEDRDWMPEGGKILTDDGPVLYLIYTADIENTAMFDATFDEAIAAKLAYAICGEVTGSTTLWEKCERIYSDAIREARRTNAFEQPGQEFPQDDWLSVRY